MATPDRELLLLQEKSDKALAEAISKLELALNETVKRTQNFVKAIRYATEAAEFASLIYALTYDLQDYDPVVQRPKHNEDPGKLLTISNEFLKLAVEKKGMGALKEGYEKLRSATEYLKRAYLDQTRPVSSRKSRMSSGRIVQRVVSERK